MRRMAVIICAAFCVALAHAKEPHREVVLPYVTLVQPAKAPTVASPTNDPAKLNEIKRLIADLENLDATDVGLLRQPVFGSVFLPVGVFGPFGEHQDKPFESNASLRKLVEFGPDALPWLLKALDAKRPTKLEVRAADLDITFDKTMAFNEVLHGNPVNPTENAVLQLHRSPYSASVFPKDSFGVPKGMDFYRVCVGDVCLVAIGQIVGRNYLCLCYDHVKPSGVVVCSTASLPNVAKKVRQIWNSENTRQKVLESLLLDFATRGLLQMDSLDYWGYGNDFQVEAAQRLLYYFPNDAAPIIADRLKSLDVSEDDHFDLCVRNGVRADDLIEAVGWSKNPVIREALTVLAAKTRNEDDKEALSRVGVIQTK